MNVPSESKSPAGDSKMGSSYFRSSLKSREDLAFLKYKQEQNLTSDGKIR